MEQKSGRKQKQKKQQRKTLSQNPPIPLRKGLEFVIRYTRLATALGNFEQGGIQTESAAVAHWLTSGLKVAMSRVGWNLLSSRYALTKLPKDILRLYYYNGYPYCQEDDRPYHQYGPVVQTEDRWDQLCGWLSGDPTFRRKLERHKQALKDQQGVSRDDSVARNKARRTAPPPGGSSSSSAARPPNRSQPPPPPPPHWWWQSGTLRSSPNTQVQHLTGLISFLKGVALAILFVLL